VKSNGQQQQPAPFGIPAPPPNPSQAALAGGVPQLLVDPTYPAGAQLFGSSPVVGNDPSGDPNAALGFTAPSHFSFTSPNTGRTTTEVNPLSGSVMTNPFGGERIHTRGQSAGMKGAKALGLGLGAYSALMNFSDDSDQDALSAAMGAGLSGYSTYGQFAQLAQHFDRQGRSQLAANLRDHANKKATEAFLAQNLQHHTGGVYAGLPSAAWQRNGRLPTSLRRGKVAVTNVPSSRRTFYGTGSGLAELPNVDYIPKEREEVDIPKVNTDSIKIVDNTKTDNTKTPTKEQTSLDKFITDEDGRIDFGWE